MKRINDFYGDHAAEYDAERRGTLEWVQEHKAVDAICRRLPRASTLLDLPCGTGRLFPHFDKYGFQFVGADISSDMLSLIPPTYSAHGLVHCDIKSLPFADEAFDYIVCLRLFHLGISESDALVILREFARVAKKGIIVHGTIGPRPLAVRILDAGAEIWHTRWRIPFEVLRKIMRVPRAMRRYQRARNSSGQSDFGSDGKDFEAANLDFKVSCSYGTISRWSTKRLYLLEKQRLANLHND